MGRFLFLREAWARIVPASDPSWIHTEVRDAEARPNDPYAGVGQSLKALLATGATEADLTNLVRGMQAQLLFHLCYLLEDANLAEEQVRDIQWGLFLLDSDGRPTKPLGGLHESVLETDPTGREVRPNESAG